MSGSPTDPGWGGGDRDASPMTISDSGRELSGVNVEIQGETSEGGTENTASQKQPVGTDSPELRQANELDLSAGTAASQQREAYGGIGLVYDKPHEELIRSVPLGIPAHDLIRPESSGSYFTADPPNDDIFPTPPPALPPAPSTNDDIFPTPPPAILPALSPKKNGALDSFSEPTRTRKRRSSISRFFSKFQDDRMMTTLVGNSNHVMSRSFQDIQRMFPSEGQEAGPQDLPVDPRLFRNRRLSLPIIESSPAVALMHEENDPWFRSHMLTGKPAGSPTRSLRAEISTLADEEEEEPPASRKDFIRALWSKATWYALQEGERRRQQAVQQDTHSSPAFPIASANRPRYNSTGGYEDVRRASAYSNSSAGSANGIQMPDSLLPDGSQKPWYYPDQIVEHQVTGVVSLCCTIYALVVPDLYWIATGSMQADYAVFTLTFVVFILLFFDLLLKSLGQKHYMPFYFVLDLVALVSFIPDVAWWAAKENLLAGSLHELSFARASRSAQLMARMARVARVFSMALRLARWVRKKFTRCFGREVKSEDDDWEAGLEYRSGFGRHLDEKVLKAVVLAVLGVLMFGMISNFVLAQREPDIMQPALEMVAGAYRRVRSSRGSTERARLLLNLELTIQDFAIGLQEQEIPILKMEVEGELMYGSDDNVKSRRPFPAEAYEVEWESGGTPGREKLKGVLILDDRTRARLYYASNISLVITVILVLCLASLLLTVTLEREVVAPVDRIMALVHAFSLDPLRPLRVESTPPPRELAAIRAVLIKLAVLLQQAYGAAGAKLIRRTLAHSGMGEVSVNSRGRIVRAFFGFCDIRNFTDLTEVLQSDVMKVVNTVAQYVHKAVTDSSGFPNKNIGDAFLLVWKPSAALANGIGVQETADDALRSYIRMILEVARSARLKKCARAKAIQDRLPGYRVKMGFGLHFGWAVEGAIGTSTKIDASYLSPHVNMSSRLEAATKQYGVEILFSEDVYHLLSTEVAELCRMVDRVTVKGSVRPLSLYTYDVPVCAGEGGTLPDEDADRVSDADMSCVEFFMRLQPHTSVEFRVKFKAALAHYLGGEAGDKANWTLAVKELEECLEMQPKDGPCLAVIDYIHAAKEKLSKTGGKWEGFRPLDEK